MATSGCRNCGGSTVPFAEFCPHCGIDRPTDEFLGRILGGSILIEALIGSGAMGDVYRGTQTNIDRPVAVKVLNNVSVNDDKIVKFFMREAKVLSKLRHPNLVSVIDFGREDDGTLFLVMELVPGTALERIIRAEAPFEIQRACRIAVQILRALEEVHGHQIVHCDLKPDNVLIEEVAGFDDFVKVVDFGVATLLDGDRTLPGSGEGNDVYGTPQYMSPEQAMGKAVDGRTDVYATGVLLYQMVTGTKPHSGDDLLDLLVQKISSDADLPSVRSPELEIPAVIDALCARAMERDQHARFANARAFREAIEVALDELRNPSSLGGHAVSADSGEATAPLTNDPFAGADVLSGDVQDHPHNFQRMTVLAVRPTIRQSAETGASTEQARLDSVWDLVASVGASLGGKGLAPSDGVGLVMFEELPGTPSLIKACRAALRLRETAVRTMGFARLGIAVFHGSVVERASRDGGSQRAPAGEAIAKVTDLLGRAQNHQILVGGTADDLLTPIFVTARHGDAIELIAHRGAEQHTSGLSVRVPSLGAQTMFASDSFVGRDLERAQVDHAVECAVSGRPGEALLLVGPDGVGKTTLAKAFRARARGAGLPVLEVYCHNRLVDRPFRPLLDLAIQAAGLERADDQGEVDPEAFLRGLILLGLSDLDARVIVEQFLAGVVPVGPAQPEVLTYEALASALHHFSATDRRHVFIVAMRNLVRHMAGSGGVAIVIEDIQRSDVGTVACMPALCALVRELPVALVATSTTDRAAGLRGFTTVPLSPLSGLELDNFWVELAQKTPGAVRASEEERAVVDASGGIPLFLASWLERPLPEGVPATLAELVGAQFQRLPGRLGRLILVSAVIGGYFERSVVEGLFPASASIGPALDGAVAARMLEPCPGEGGLWRFRHDAIRSILYGKLSAEDRARYHQSIYDGLTRDQTPTSSRQLLLMATHADRAGLGLETLEVAEALADRFMVAGDPAVAEFWYARALTAAQRVMQQRQTLGPGRLDELILKAAESFLRAGHGERAMALLAQLPSTARPEHRAFRRTLTARVYRAAGNTAAALGAAGQPTRQQLIALPVAAWRAALRAEMLIETGDTAAALEGLKELADDLATNVVVIPETMAHLRWTTLRLYGEAAANSGDHDRGEEALRDAFILARRAGDGVSLVGSLGAMAQYLIEDGRPEELVSLCRDAFSSEELALRLPQRLAVHRILYRAHRAMYDRAAAQKDLRKARAIAEELGWERMVRDLDVQLSAGS